MIICNINATAGILQNRLQRNIGTGKSIFGDPPSQFALNDPSHIPDKPNIAGLPASCFSVFEKTEIHHDLAVHLQGLKGCSIRTESFREEYAKELCDIYSDKIKAILANAGDKA